MTEAPPPRQWPPTAPHVIYKTDKKPEQPCSITSSLSYFPDEEANDLNVTSRPRVPPSNLTVVTVEGCPSFIILDWQKSDNETTGKVGTASALKLPRSGPKVKNSAVHIPQSFRV